MKLLEFNRASGRIKEVEVDIGGGTTPPPSGVKSIPLMISGSSIQAGDSVTLYMPYGLRIDGYALHTDVAATLALDVRAVAPEDMPSDEADRISGSTPPTLSAGNFVSDNVLDGWLRMVPENRVIVAKITSVTGNVRNVTLQFDVVEGVPGYPLLWFTASSEENILSYTVPSILYAADHIDEYPQYTHVAGVVVGLPVLLYSATSVDEFPTYNHTTAVVLTPTILFTVGDVEQFPTYEQNTFSSLTFDAGDDVAVNQWVFLSKTLVPSSGAAPFAYDVSGLPTGVVSATNDGVLTVSGIPETAGTHTVTVSVTDRAGRVVSDTFSIVVSSATRIPAITETVGQNFAVSATAVLRGYNFDNSVGALFVDGVDHTANVTAWSATEIEFTVPSGVANPSNIYVVAFGQNSNVISRNIAS